MQQRTGGNMARLNDRAFRILVEEAKRCAAAEEVAGDIQQRLALKQLERLRAQGGAPASQDELRQAVDLFANFDPKVLKSEGKWKFVSTLLQG